MDVDNKNLESEGKIDGKIEEKSEDNERAKKLAIIFRLNILRAYGHRIPEEYNMNTPLIQLLHLLNVVAHRIGNEIKEKKNCDDRLKNAHNFLRILTAYQTMSDSIEKHSIFFTAVTEYYRHVQECNYSEEMEIFETFFTNNNNRILQRCIESLIQELEITDGLNNLRV